MAQHRQPHLVFLGIKGQLDPTRGQSAAKRVIGSAMLSLGLLVRRLGGRPMLWVRAATLRPRRTRDPVEQLLAPLLRFLAREVPLDDVPDLVDADEADEASEA